MATKAQAYEIGAIVKWTAKFLKSTGQYTGAPRNGKVIRLSDLTTPEGVPFPVVHWCDRPEEYACAVNPHNIMPYGKADRSGL